MSIGKQMKTLKDNWLLVLILLMLVFLPAESVVTPFMDGALSRVGVPMAEDMIMNDVARAGVAMPPYYDDDDFAPEAEDRLITRTASLASEVKHGAFGEATDRVKGIVRAAEGVIVNEHMNTVDTEWREYQQASFQVKVESGGYNDVIDELKQVGKVLSFVENDDDVTGRHMNLEVNMAAEKARLKRYEQLFESAETVQDKLKLSDRIFNQERTIAYIEDALDNVDRRVSYAAISVNVQEKRSEYADVVFVKVSELVKNFVSSLNSVLKVAVFLVPWAVLLWIVHVVRRGRKRR